MERYRFKLNKSFISKLGFDETVFNVKCYSHPGRFPILRIKGSQGKIAFLLPQPNFVSDSTLIDKEGQDL